MYAKLVGGILATRMSVTVVICTRNRASVLARCLDHFRRIEDPGCPWEMAVVDNGSTDQTPRVLEDFARNAPCPVWTLREPIPGASRSKNLAIGRSSSPIISLVDDDCYVRPDHLKRILEVFHDPAIGYTGGSVLLFDPTDAPVAIGAWDAPRRIPARESFDIGILLGANLAIRRVVWEQLGGFDPLLGPGTPVCGAEDADLVQRACDAGWDGFLNPDCVVYHHHGRKPGADVFRLRANYCLGDGAVRAKLLLAGGGAGRPLGRARKRQLKHAYWALHKLCSQGEYRLAGYLLLGAWRYCLARLKQAIRRRGA
jgi:glycosyltransferase involved in cell wall biosynthesis